MSNIGIGAEVGFGPILFLTLGLLDVTTKKEKLDASVK